MVSLCSAVMTNIHNFKMSAYLELSCSYNGHWVLPFVVLTSLLYNLAIWLSCYQGRPGDWLCEDSLTLPTYQLLICLTLLAYLNVLSDLFTGKLKRLLAGIEVPQIRERIRNLLRWGNNSVSPLEECDSRGRVEVNSQETGNNQQNIIILKDHIR